VSPIIEKRGKKRGGWDGAGRRGGKATAARKRIKGGGQKGGSERRNTDYCCRGEQQFGGEETANVVGGEPSYYQHPWIKGKKYRKRLNKCSSHKDKKIKFLMGGLGCGH